MVVEKNYNHKNIDFEAGATARFKLKNVTLLEAKNIMKIIKNTYGYDIQDIEIRISNEVQ